MDETVQPEDVQDTPEAVQVSEPDTDAFAEMILAQLVTVLERLEELEARIADFNKRSNHRL